MKPPKYLDVILFSAAFMLLCMGVLMVFSSSLSIGLSFYGDPFYFVKRQLVWVVLGFFAFLVGLRVPLALLRNFSGYLMLCVFFLLCVVLVPGIGRSAGGATRWIDFGGLSFQPSEMAKFCLVLFMAAKLSSLSPDDRCDLNQGILPFVVLLSMLCALVVLQPDLGTCLVLVAAFFGILFVSGTRVLHLTGLALFFIMAFIFLVKLEPYRMQRVAGFLNPRENVQTINYQSWQSLLAVGSGGVTGVGIGNSRQKFLYLPSPHTDFIFSIVAEELGFLGALVVVLLFGVVAWRGFFVAHEAKHDFLKILTGGLTFCIVFQALLNISVSINLLPVTGVPLPFLSFGGSSLFFTLLSMGVILNVSGSQADGFKGFYESSRVDFRGRRAFVSRFGSGIPR